MRVLLWLPLLTLLLTLEGSPPLRPTTRAHHRPRLEKQKQQTEPRGDAKGNSFVKLLPDSDVFFPRFVFVTPILILRSITDPKPMDYLKPTGEDLIHFTFATKFAGEGGQRISWDYKLTSPCF